VFTGKPFSYSGGQTQVLDDIDFAGMDKGECMAFLERFTHQRCVNLYYCLPDLELPEGLKLIDSDFTYADFIFLAYESGVVLPLYVDNLDTNIQELLNDDKGELTSADDQISAAPNDINVDLGDLNIRSGSHELHVDVDVEEISSVPKTVIDDPFLTKLCPRGHGPIKASLDASEEDEVDANDEDDIDGTDEDDEHDIDASGEDEMGECDPLPEVHPS